MRSSSSARKPFITAMTMISAATPSVTPTSEMIVTMETAASLRRGFR